MKTNNTHEFALIRSKALDYVIALAISALIMLPIVTLGKGRDKEASNGKVYMHPLQKDAHAAVTIAQFGEGKFSLSVESENGNDVYYNEILESPESFSKVFDFSKLEDGEYTLKVKVKKDIKISHFSIKNGELIVAKKNTATPVFKTEGQKAVFVLPNQNKQAYALSIVSPSGEEVYSTYSSDATIKKQFDFSLLKEGSYELKVSSKLDDYTFSFNNQK